MEEVSKYLPTNLPTDLWFNSHSPDELVMASSPTLRVFWKRTFATVL